MININLLPPEFRQADGTPLPVFLLILVGLVVAALGVVALVWINDKVQANAGQRLSLENMQIQLEAKKKELKRLNEELKEKGKQKDTILRIRKNRILWAKKLHRLASRTPAKDIWWQWVKMDQKDPKPDLADGGELTIDCYQKGVRVSTLAAYREAIQKDKVLWRGFQSMSPPEYKSVIWRGADPSEEDALNYTLTLYLEPPKVLPIKKSSGTH